MSAPKYTTRHIAPSRPDQSFSEWREANAMVTLDEAAGIVGVFPDSDTWKSVRRMIPGGEFVSFDGDRRWVVPVDAVRSLKRQMGTSAGE